MKPESIYYLFETGTKTRQEDYIWPVAGKATANDKVFIVCDGAGRFSSGEIASKLICQFMAAKVLKFSEQKMSGELIRKLLIEARYRLSIYASKKRLDTELSTTFSMIIIYNQKVLMSWCGDGRIYHLRGGEILFRAEDNSRNTAIGIKADSSPINTETKWIEDVQDGDYFLLCSKGIMESVTDDDIKLLVSQNDKAKIDLTGSFRQLALEKTPGNYSMYLIRVKGGVQKRSLKSGITAIRKRGDGILSKVFILAMTIVGLLIVVFYFRKTSSSGPIPKYKNQTTQPANVLRDDSVHGSNVMPAPRKPILTVTDSNATAIQAEEKPGKSNQTTIAPKKRVAQLLLKFTTDESCKIKITNLDLDQVIDWDLSPSENGTLYLKPGKYSIVATSVVNSSKTKTYHFDVKPEDAHTTQDLQIRF